MGSQGKRGDGVDWVKIQGWEGGIQRHVEEKHSLRQSLENSGERKGLGWLEQSETAEREGTRSES